MIRYTTTMDFDALIKAKFEKGNIDVNLLRSVDLDGDGEITRAEFQLILKKKNVIISNEEIDRLFEKYCPCSNTKLVIEKLFAQDSPATKHRIPTSATEKGLDAIQILQVKIQQKKTTYHERFLDCDLNRDGVVTTSELVQLAVNMQIVPLRASLQELEDALIYSGAACMDFAAFVPWLKMASTTKLDASKDTQLALKMIGDALFSKIHTIKTLFETLDKDQDNSISVEELQVALESAKVFISPTTLSLLVKKFDDSGRLHWPSFLQMVLKFEGTPKLSEFGLTAHEFTIIGQLCEKFHQEKKTMIEIFQSMDQNHDGLITERELSDGLKKFGLQNISDDEVSEIFKAFDTGKGIDYVAFLNMMTKKYAVI